MASLRQIAEELNVHVTLVSKVLNGRMGTTGARQELIDQIHRTAREMGYRKNVNAAALKAGRQQVIAVFIHRHGQPGTNLVESLLSGISGVARKQHQRLTLAFYEGVQDFTQIVQATHLGAVDGLIIAGKHHASLMDEVIGIQAAGVPIVTLLNNPISDSLPNVGMPEDQIIAVAMRHLIERGRRRILHISSMKIREEGYFNALRNAGISIDPRMVYREPRDGVNEFTAGNGARAVSNAFDRGLTFDAICAQSDTQAIGAMHELMRRGVRIPQDVMITGVDDSPFAALAVTPLTSVSQRYEERGRKAVRLLSSLIDGRKAKSACVAPQVVARQSTATES